MFATIIVGTDGRQGGRDALALAERLRSVSGGGIVAVQAYPYEFFVSRGANADFDAVMRDDVQTELEAELDRMGISAETVVVADGSPARALHRVAEEHEAGVIVVGSAHHGRLGRVLAGDVAAGTLHASPCPVVVAPAGYADRDGELAAVGVGFDGSPESRAAVDLAHRLADAAGVPLRVLSVLEPSVPGGAYPASIHDWSGGLEGVRAEARADLDELVTELGPGVSGEILEGDPVRELIYAGKELSLLVCGSRSYGPLRRLLLGSTSSRLVREAPFPMLVLPRGAAETGAAEDAAEVAAHAS
ncbi:MAG: universal stress protein [Solirubrobacteraceae bacterium]